MVRVREFLDIRTVVCTEVLPLPAIQFFTIDPACCSANTAKHQKLVCQRGSSWVPCLKLHLVRLSLRRVEDMNENIRETGTLRLPASVHYHEVSTGSYQNDRRQTHAVNQAVEARDRPPPNLGSATLEQLHSSSTRKSIQRPSHKRRFAQQ